MGATLEKRKPSEKIAEEIAVDIKEKAEEVLNKEHKTEQEKLKARKGISTGLVMLNLALTDNPYEGYKLGTIVNLVGDFSSGKTFLAFTMFAEALRNKKFDKYALIYDEPERAFSIDESLFGSGTSRIDKSIKSVLITDVHKNVLQQIKNGPFIYVLDSFDAVTTKEEVEREKKLLKEKKKKEEEEDDSEVEEVEDTKGKGTYNLEKQKYSNTLLRSIIEPLDKSESLFLVISQTRQKINAMFGDKKTRSGGDALHFYSTSEIWLSVKEHLSKSGEEVGVEVLAKIKKNKTTGKLRKIKFDIFYDYGVDNLGSMIDWLIEKKCWGYEKGKKDQRKKVINTCTDFPDDMSREELIKYIEEDKTEEEKLVKVMAMEWRKHEEELKTNRKPKYA